MFYIHIPVYIYGTEGFAKHATVNEVINVYNAEKKKRHDPKRWDDGNFGRGIYDNDGEKMREKMKQNALRGNIVKA